jgi:hypothetical protein
LQPKRFFLFESGAQSHIWPHVNRTPGKECDEVTLFGDSIEKAIQNSHVAVCYRNHW